MALTGKEAAKVMTPISGFRTSARYFPRNQQGFTLLELLLVFSIIAVASVLMFPNVSSLDSRSFSVQVRQANQMLNFARRDSVVRGQPSTVRLHAQPLEEDEQTVINPNVVASWESEGIQLSFLDSTDNEFDINESIDVTFYPEGGSTGGTLLLALDEQTARIVIDPFTGRISNELDEEE